jgi:hypothetical protein
MATVQSEVNRDAGDSPKMEHSNLSSAAPLSKEGISELNPTPSVVTGGADVDTEAPDGVAGGEKSSKRKFWNLGKKKLEDKVKGNPESSTTVEPSSAPLAPLATMRSASPLYSPETRGSASPQRARYPYGAPASPGRNMHSSSPRLHSPASSQIFERSVQEEMVPSQASPAIPSHIITENHIPPVLEEASAAITDDHLDPDAVEIITHTAHQPASVTVTGASDPSANMSSSFSFHDDLSAHPNDFDEGASNYGSLDTNDVRRLSFISFADVVHAEHSHDPDHHTHLPTRNSVHNLTGLSTTMAIPPPRSPSPLHSPISSHGGTAPGTSPPNSVSPSFKGVETSPNRIGRGAQGSPLGIPAHSPPLSGGLNVETMRQALRKTGSGDLSGFRSQPLSAVGDTPIGDGEGPFGRALR